MDGGFNYEPPVASNAGSATYGSLGPGNYDLVVRFESDDCEVSLGSVFFAPPELPELEPVDQEICIGETATLSVNVTGGVGPFTYDWDGLGTDENPQVSPTVTTTYSVTVTGSNNCSASAQVTVTVYSLPELTEQHYRIEATTWISGNTVTICENQEVELGFAGSDYDGWTFDWTGPNGFSQSIDDSPNILLSNVGLDEAGDYDVTYTDPNGCQNSASFTIIVEGVQVQLGPNVDICEGETTTITAVVTGGVAPYSYTWNPVLPDQASHDVTPTVNTTYEVTVTDATGCIGTDQKVVRIEANPQATITQTDPICDETTGSITLAFPNTSGRTYIEFSLNGGSSYQPSVPDNSGSVTYSGLAPGTYDLWARWGNNECPVDLLDVTIEENTTPVPDLNETVSDRRPDLGFLVTR